MVASDDDDERLLLTQSINLRMVRQSPILEEVDDFFAQEAPARIFWARGVPIFDGRFFRLL